MLFDSNSKSTPERIGIMAALAVLKARTSQSSPPSTTILTALFVTSPPKSPPGSNYTPMSTGLQWTVGRITENSGLESHKQLRAQPGFPQVWPLVRSEEQPEEQTATLDTWQRPDAAIMRAYERRRIGRRVRQPFISTYQNHQ